MLRAEFVKMKRTTLFWMHILVPIVGTGIVLWYYKRLGALDMNVKSIGEFLEILSLAFPTLSGIVCALGTEMEVDAGNMQVLLGGVAGKCRAGGVKLVALLLLGAMGTLLALGSYLVGIYLYSGESFSGELLLFTVESVFILLGTQIAIYVIHFFLSLKWHKGVVVATVVYLCSLICNVGINAVLIFGLFGMPALGVKGAAIGTLTARLLEMALVCLYSHFWNKDIKFHTKYFLHTEKVLNRDFLKYAFPVILNEVLWGLGTAANTAVLGHMGSAAVAANSVAQVARQLATVVAFGLASATAIYLGKTIGEKKYEHAKAYARRFVWLSVLMGVLGGILILAIAPFMAEAMTLSETARWYMRFMFFVMSYFVVGQAYNTTLVVGTFRSGGDTQFGLILDMSTMWGCSILFGALAAFVFHCNVPVVYMILMSDEIIKIPITWYRYKSYKWLKNVTREEL